MEESIIKQDDLIRVAKRENNTKRPFLYVNPMQGKHIPVSPSKALDLFELLAARVDAAYPGEKLVVIGFSETATAIGSALAVSCRDAAAFLTTTRENVADASYLYFSESHSHATEQRLVINGLEPFLCKADRVIFAEDEVTTGNTILKLIAVMRDMFSSVRLKFGIASLLNSMTDEKLQALAEQGIGCTYLARIPFAYRTDEITRYQYELLRTEPKFPQKITVRNLHFASDWNQRIAADASLIRRNCTEITETTVRALGAQSGKKLLILGTEEFMYPGLLLGSVLEKQGNTVRFHATTRSPIEISSDAAYPLHKRDPLVSFYDETRQTFIYNLEQYDHAVIVTDAPDVCRRGLDTLTGALEDCGNTDVTVVRWGAAEE